MPERFFHIGEKGALIARQGRCQFLFVKGDKGGSIRSIGASFNAQDRFIKYFKIGPACETPAEGKIMVQGVVLLYGGTHCHCTGTAGQKQGTVNIPEKIFHALAPVVKKKINCHRISLLIGTRFQYYFFESAAQILRAADKGYFGTALGLHVIFSAEIATVKQGNFRFICIKI